MGVTQIAAMPQYRIVTARKGDGVSVAANAFVSSTIPMPVPDGWAIAAVWARTWSQWMVLVGAYAAGSSVVVHARNVGTSAVGGYTPQAWALLVPEALLVT